MHLHFKRYIARPHMWDLKKRENVKILEKSEEKT